MKIPPYDIIAIKSMQNFDIYCTVKRINGRNESGCFCVYICLFELRNSLQDVL